MRGYPTTLARPDPAGPRRPPVRRPGRPVSRLAHGGGQDLLAALPGPVLPAPSKPSGLDSLSPPLEALDQCLRPLADLRKGQLPTQAANSAGGRLEEVSLPPCPFTCWFPPAATPDCGWRCRARIVVPVSPAISGEGGQNGAGVHRVRAGRWSCRCRQRDGRGRRDGQPRGCG